MSVTRVVWFAARAALRRIILSGVGYVCGRAISNR
jgi:hypothetical protein